MGQKRKRPSRSIQPAKRKKVETPKNKDPLSDHPVLKHYYEKVLTLREYIITRLESTSRQELAQCILKLGQDEHPEIGELLDTVTVGANSTHSPLCTRAQDIAAFSQQLPSSTLGSNSDPGANRQLEVS
ncbi:hypothetical protein EJ08DRAFT_389986 [Tothia fuscella]|uniref:Uncharacterized protein n=1 Tax=Tothia fuscella TaxID=1048955 RepID=A0A9P4P1T9_9PEZI|nr:hypothetical protein EJ08DRAFT_389986 [Tothia fuscella]